MKAFINPGHKVGIDPGACNPDGTQEADIALRVGKLVCDYLNVAGVETELLQSNSLNGEDEDANNPSICRTANESDADIFVSIHCIQNQIVDSLGTVDRGIKTRPNLAVLRDTIMPAVLVELAFIDNADDLYLLKNKTDEFARAIARGITDYQLSL